MATITLCLPKMGESILEALVLNWHVQEGGNVEEGEILLEVATDKVDAEVPATCNGVIKKILVQSGSMVAVGQSIALLETRDCTTSPFVQPLSEKDPTITSQPLVSRRERNLPHTEVTLSPLAKKIIQANEIPSDTLVRLARPKDNKVTKDTLQNYLLPSNNHPNPSLQPLSTDSQRPTQEIGDQSMKMDRVRKIIAERMIASKRISPHVTSFIRADVTDLVAWYKQTKRQFQDQHQVHLTYLTIFMVAVAKALSKFPLLNAMVVEDEIIIKKKINIGFAVALPNDHLIVPVIQQVDQLSLLELARQTSQLIKEARSGTLSPDALNGGTYTISNIGSFNNIMGTPIIVQPQVAILAIGAIERRPGIVHVQGKETIAIRDELFFSHTYDHRLIDGAMGGGFLKYLVETLTSFAHF